MQTLRVRRRALDLEQLWKQGERAALVSALDGRPSRLATTVDVSHDGARLAVVFDGEDDAVVASHYERDAPLWQEDVFEVFLAPERLERYYEFELSPAGTLFDAQIDSPDRDRKTMRADLGWDCEGFWGAVRTEYLDAGRMRIQAVLVIPFAGLGVEPPAPGTEWRANFYRIDRSSSGDLYDAWSPTLRTPPDFHVPERFGRLTFE